MQYQGIAFA